MLSYRDGPTHSEEQDARRLITLPATLRGNSAEKKESEY